MFIRGIILFAMHRTFARISEVKGAEMAIGRLCTLIEAHEERWEADTLETQRYEFTIESQRSGVDLRRIAGADHRTEGGAFSVFAAGTEVVSERILTGPLRVEYVRLGGPLASDIESALGVRPDRPLILPQAPAALPVALAHAANLVFRRLPGWQWALVSALADLTRDIMASRQETPCSAARVVDRVRVLVEASPQNPWTVKELADLLGVRRAALWRAFRDRTGLSPAVWMRRHRIRVARAMLARGLSVRQTAERLGFSSRQQFARAYKAVTGHAPTGERAGESPHSP